MQDKALVFYQQYLQLNEKSQKIFSRLVNKLLNVNFLTQQKENELEDYYFITNHLELFKAYFSFMDCELIFDINNRVIALYNNQDSNRLNLNLNQSIILLILRLLYNEKSEEISIIDKLTITLKDIHEMFLSTGLKDRRISKTELKSILSLFKRFNLLDFIDKNVEEDNTRLILYPTLLYAIKLDNISKIYDKLLSYRKQGEDSEETSAY